jgi:hypothetical protein
MNAQIPCFCVEVVRTSLTDAIAAVDLSGAGAFTTRAQACIGVLTSIESLCDRKGTEFIPDCYVTLNKATEIGIAAGRSPFSYLAAARWTAVVPPPAPVDGDVVRAAVAQAEKETNDDLFRRLRAMEISKDRELQTKIAALRAAIDAGGEPAELAAAQAALEAMSQIDVDAAWPVVRFAEVAVSATGT